MQKQLISLDFVPSTIWADFVDELVNSGVSSTIWADFVDELRGRSRAFLQKLAVLEAVPAVVEIDAAAGVAPAVFVFCEGHAATLAKLGQLAGH